MQLGHGETKFLAHSSRDSLLNYCVSSISKKLSPKPSLAQPLKVQALWLMASSYICMNLRQALTLSAP